MCRVLPPLTHSLADTTLLWAQRVAPVAERMAAMLAQAPGAKIHRSMTPLTGGTRSRAKGGRARAQRVPRPRKRSTRCGNPVPHKRRSLCDACYAAYLADRGVKRRCKGCGERVPNRWRTYCDACWADHRSEWSQGSGVELVASKGKRR